ncbi:hypothetical protein ABW19_dt0202069 [Dactylella cylindrospora]|nr:hypothetical protein ABW19_dt0202069 [Dactylella cylindrospora]
MFEQILIRFRGGPITNTKDGEDESDGNSSDTATSPSPSEDVVERETLQLPLSRSMAYKLSPSPSIERSPSPSDSTSSSTTSSSSSVSANNSDTGRVQSLQRHLTSPHKSASASKAASAAQMKSRRELPARKSTRNSVFNLGRLETREGSRGQKRKASEMTAAQPNTGNQVGAEPPPEKRITRAEAKKEEDEKKRTTRSGRQLGVAADCEQIGGSSLNRTGSSKRKSPFLEPRGHVLKRPTSRRRRRSISPERSQEEQDSEGEESHDNYGETEATDAGRAIEDDGVVSHRPSTRSKTAAHPHAHNENPVVNIKKPSSTSTTTKAPPKHPLSHSHPSNLPANINIHISNVDEATMPRRRTTTRSEEPKKRKLHILLRLGPDNLGFPWWHNDAWIREEGARGGKKRRLDYDTSILVVDSDSEDEDGGSREPSTAPHPQDSGDKKERPRKLRSTARGASGTIPVPQTPTTTNDDGSSITTATITPPSSAPTVIDESPLPPGVEKYEYPTEIINAPLPKKDPLADSRYVDYHEIKRNHEKADHTKEFIKEKKNFNLYTKFLSEIQETNDDEEKWMELLGVEPPEDESGVKKLLKKKNRLVEELKAIQKRYPVYKEERERIDAKTLDPSFSGWMEKHKRKPLHIKGRYISNHDLESDYDSDA